MKTYIKQFSEISINDVPVVGGKNASLGEMFSKLSAKGIKVPNGFATTAEAYKDFLLEENLGESLKKLLKQLDRNTYANLKAIGTQARILIEQTDIPELIENAVIASLKIYVIIPILKWLYEVVPQPKI